MLGKKYSEEEILKRLNDSEDFRKLLNVVLKELPEQEIKDYDSPGWAFKEADRLGYNRAIKELLTIINVEGDHP